MFLCQHVTCIDSAFISSDGVPVVALSQDCKSGQSHRPVLFN